MKDRRGARRRMRHGAAVVAAIMLISGCAPQPAAGPDDWALEPISFRSSFTGSGSDAAPAGHPIDLTYGMHVLSADGAGGFWTASSGSWLHVGADGDTLARFDTEPGDPLSQIAAMAPLSTTELVVLRGDRIHVMPMLSVLDTTTMTMRDLPGDAVGDEGDFDYGDFEFGDVAVHDGDAIVVRYQPRPPTNTSTTRCCASTPTAGRAPCCTAARSNSTMRRALDPASLRSASTSTTPGACISRPRLRGSCSHPTARS